ncbi:hypothetical protein L195_g058787, partial [Trifolium pratense]
IRGIGSQGEMRCSSSSSRHPENLHMELVIVIELVMDMKLVSELFTELHMLILVFINEE